MPSGGVGIVERETAVRAAAVAAPLRPSHVRGATEPALLDLTVAELFDEACARWPDRPALVACHQNVRWTYREWAGEVERVAAGLLALGLEPGERIALWSRNRVEWPTVQIAAAKAGLVFVGLNPSYTAAELEYVLHKLGCAALILAPGAGRDDFLGRLRALVPELASAAGGRLAAARLPRLRHVILLGAEPAPGTTRLAEIVARGERLAGTALRRTTPRPRPDEPAAVLMTSGTTAAAKGVTLSHRQIVNNGFFVGETLHLSARDRVCLPVPLYHSFGMIAGILSALSHGAAVMLPAEGFQPLQTLRAIAGERATAVLGVPTMFLAMMEHASFADFDLSSLRTGIMSCSPCPAELLRRAIDQMHLRDITTAYGMTETSPVSFQSVPDDPLERRVGTAGRVHPHVEAKIVDTIGATVPIGRQGELMVRGYSVMSGYWQDESQTREAIDGEGWLRTGDLAVIDADGYCRIVGRLKDTIIRGGENIAPREVEELLHRHPKILDAQVVGIPDARQGEAVCAWIRLRDGETATVREIRDFCRGQISRYKVPRHVLFTDTFPMTANGKVQKFVLRERGIAELRRAR